MTSPKKSVTRIQSDYMNQYNKKMARKNLRKKRLMQRLVFASLVIVITFGVLLTYHINQRSLYAEKEKQYEELTEKIVTLKKDEKNLQEEINLLNDEEYILDIARTNYFLSKEGEIIFQVDKKRQRSY